MNAQPDTGTKLFRQGDHNVTNESLRHPKLYVLAELGLLGLLAALAYGLFKML